MTRYFLTGLPQCGKTTLAKKAAPLLSLTFVDLDEEIEKLTGKTCREYFLKEGELAFREKEQAALKKLSSRDNLLVALGGGALKLPENRLLIKKLGTLIYLREDPVVLEKRLLKKETPAYLKESRSFLKLAEERIPFYEREADRIIELKQRAFEAILKEFLDGF